MVKSRIDLYAGSTYTLGNIVPLNEERLKAAHLTRQEKVGLKLTLTIAFVLQTSLTMFLRQSYALELIMCSA